VSLAEMFFSGNRCELIVGLNGPFLKLG